MRQACDLIPKDPNGLSDAYVKITLIPESTKSPSSHRNRSKHRTAVIKANLNSEWHETLTINLLKHSDSDRRLLIETYDHDRGRNDDFIGCLSFGIPEILRSPREGWFKLLNAEEGAFYNIPVTADAGPVVRRRPTLLVRPKVRLVGQN